MTQLRHSSSSTYTPEKNGPLIGSQILVLLGFSRSLVVLPDQEEKFLLKKILGMVKSFQFWPCLVVSHTCDTHIAQRPSLLPAPITADASKHPRSSLFTAWIFEGVLPHLVCVVMASLFVSRVISF